MDFSLAGELEGLFLSLLVGSHARIPQNSHRQLTSPTQPPLTSPTPPLKCTPEQEKSTLSGKRHIRWTSHSLAS
jgi:hypothetical protein